MMRAHLLLVGNQFPDKLMFLYQKYVRIATESGRWLEWVPCSLPAWQPVHHDDSALAIISTERQGFISGLSRVTIFYEARTCVHPLAKCLITARVWISGCLRSEVSLLTSQSHAWNSGLSPTSLTTD